MSIPNDQVPKTMHVVSGADVTQFSYDFYAPDTANIYVLVDGVAVSSGWTVSSASTSEGMVEFDSPVVMGATVTVYRSTPMTQPVDLEQGDTFYPQVVTEALDNVVMGMQELRGGTVNIPGEGAASAAYATLANHASTADYATTADSANSAGLALTLDGGFVVNSATHATTAGGLDSGVIVDSAFYASNASAAVTANGAEFATSAAFAFSAGVAPASGGTASYASNASHASSADYATNAGYAAVAGELVAGATVSYAENAGHADEADIASALTSDAKSDILNSAGGNYSGPFAVRLDATIGTVGCDSGYVYAGGSRYLVEGFDTDTITVDPYGGTVYLTLLSSGGSVTPGLVTSTSGLPADTVIVRLAERHDDTIMQIQYGDITTVPWGLEGGGGGGATDNRHDRKEYVSVQGSTASFDYIDAVPNTVYYVALQHDLWYDDDNHNLVYNYYMQNDLGGGQTVRTHTNFSDLTGYYDAGTNAAYGIEFKLPTPTSACSIEIRTMPNSNVAISFAQNVSVINNNGTAQNPFVAGSDKSYIFDFVNDNGLKIWYLTILV